MDKKTYFLIGYRYVWRNYKIIDRVKAFSKNNAIGLFKLKNDFQKLKNKYGLIILKAIEFLNEEVQ